MFAVKPDLLMGALGMSGRNGRSDATQLMPSCAGGCRHVFLGLAEAY